MLETPQILRIPPQTVASLRLTVPWSEMRTVMGPALAELKSTVAAQQIALTGPWFSHHFRKPTDTFDFELCLPLASAITAAGRVQPGVVPARTVARATYRGGYEGLGNAWSELGIWLVANKHTAAADFYECYRVGPESGGDATQWQTELTWPLA